jgi:hypothetical protein
MNNLRQDAISTINDSLVSMVTIGVITPHEHIQRIDRANALPMRDLLVTMNKTYDESMAYVWDYNVAS